MGEASGDFNNQPTQEKPFRPKSLDFLEKLRFAYKKPTVEGKENLPPGPCVIAATHLSGYDVFEIYAEATKDRKTAMALQASILNHPLFKRIANIVGKENFLPLSNDKSTVLRNQELEQMKNAILIEGKTMVVAAHTPTKAWKLTDNPGMAAVILAHQTNVSVVPAVFDIKSRIPVREGVISQVKHIVLRRHPDSKIIFGNPMSFPEISEDKLQSAINLFSTDKRRAMTQQEVKEAHATLEILRNEAGEVMKSLASNLPLEKRGKWG